ncbi:type I-E CRISPR-associated protein Cse1/CasA [Marinobacter nauticus]|jgi:CRISPR system Cascade subunit CasA|uniref:Type I-E CRISPR-associated protein Cse1/CasA n=1 Tax=Marinobacter nauticus TaxID=2743 RepID=A0A1M2V0Q5_MARNT|nr:type I-E CRISPR-associated protein Cse1/CasA [Marinobacter nauticus]OJT01171.1 type I-E CRISPR-associated protein Cse1/CasA [Marinobacter nauticus]
MNLLLDPWLPFERRGGSLEYLPVTRMVSPDVFGLALPRADFQGAAYQFLIGLLQTAFAPSDIDQWMEYYKNPPSEQQLTEAFSSFQPCFELNGPGPCFMQDFDGLESEAPASVAGLLIDSPGASTIKNNTDHFVKDGRVKTVCPHCAAIALFTMQINAPSGGKGYRTGLRGGGPLTTLLLPSESASTLWQKLWINVLESGQFNRTDEVELNVFPWMVPTRTSEKGQTTLPNQVHPLHVYWAMPRRFRLNIEPKEARCDLCGREIGQSVCSIRARNYGNNYDGPWLHPLTPYRRDPKQPHEPPLSIKGQPAGIGYRHWESLVFEDAQQEGNLPALNVTAYVARVDECEAEGVALPRAARIWAFGYDMDNMKSRGWVGTQLPFLALPERHQERLQGWLRTLVGFAKEVCWQLRRSTKEAWFKRPSEAKGDLEYIDARFWESTEQRFYELLSELGHRLLDDDIKRLPTDLSQVWYQEIRSQAFAIFDDLTLSGPPEALNMKRITKARNAFLGWFNKNKVAKNFRKQAGLDEKLSKGGESNQGG